MLLRPLFTCPISRSHLNFTEDYDERTSLTSYRMFFSILGSLLAFTVPLMIVGSFTPENSGKVLLMGAIFGLGSALPLLAGLFQYQRARSICRPGKTKIPGITESCI